MRLQLFILAFILISFGSLSQTKDKNEDKVFLAIVYHEIEVGSKGIFLQCEKRKTHFNSEAFKKETTLEVPDKILNQLTESAKRSADAKWNPRLPETLEIGTEFLRTNECLSRDEILNLFDTTKKRQTILSISQPIFDDNFEHCIVSISYWNFTSSASGHTYFLKNIYGKWVIVSKYNSWIT